MNHMHGNQSQRSKLTRVLQTESLETRTLMASDVATALQGYLTGSNHQDMNVPAQIAPLLNNWGTTTAAARVGSGASGWSNLGSALQGNVGSSVQGNGWSNLGQLAGTASQSGFQNLANRITWLTSNTGIGSQTNSALDAAVNRWGNLNSLANRFTTGLRPLDDRIGAASTLGNSGLGWNLNANSNASVQARDIVFGSDFGSNLNANVGGQNSLGTSVGSRSGWILTGTQPSDHTTQADRIIFSRAGGLNTNVSSQGSTNLSTGARTGGWILTGTQPSDHTTLADRIALVRAGLNTNTGATSSGGWNFGSNTGTVNTGAQSTQTLSSNLPVGGWMLTGSHSIDNPTTAQRIIFVKS
ncbi:MAG: hypothetical protein ACTHK7_16660 [Aureliella sp.]